MAIQSRTIRNFLFAFIASICACALLGIYTLAIGRLGRTEEKILGSTVLVAVTFLLGLFASVPTVRRRWHPLGPVTLCFLPVPLTMVLIEIWHDSGYYGSPDWEFWREFERWMAVSWVMGVTLPVLCLLSLARLKRAFQWVHLTTVIVGLLLSILLSISILANVFDDEWGRLLGILGILTAAGCITVPILHRVSAIPLVERIHTTKLEISLTCPRCGKPQVLPAGGANCLDCKLRINIDIEEEQCRTCGYPLYKIDSAQCPECGTPISRTPAPQPAA